MFLLVQQHGGIRNKDNFITPKHILFSSLLWCEMRRVPWHYDISDLK